MDSLSTRHRDILRAIVQSHLDSGEPVGSASIAQDVAASPATVRSVMADLEELGFLEKPHTSAGRIPTDRGYRYYVDAFVQLKEPTRPERELIEQRLTKEDPDLLLKETSLVLSSMSHYAAVVMAPPLASVQLERVEFIKLKEDRVLAVLVLESGLVQNRLLNVGYPVAAEELVRAANLLNSLLGKTPLEVVRERIVQLMTEEKNEVDQLMRRALELGRRAFEAVPSSAPASMHIEGQGSFFSAKEFADIGRVRALFQAFEEKSKLLALLDQTLTAREIQIFIGAESPFSAETGVSVVAAPYQTDTGVVGTIGVIGPTRMNYGRAVTLVDFTARLLSRRLDAQ